MGLFSAVFGIVLIAVIADTIGKIVKARGAGPSPRQLADIRQQFEDQAAALDHQGRQILELQERSDFMERLLAKTREGTALNPANPAKPPD